MTTPGGGMTNCGDAAKGNPAWSLHTEKSGVKVKPPHSKSSHDNAASNRGSG